MWRRLSGLGLMFVLSAPVSAQTLEELVERMTMPDWKINDYRVLRNRRDPGCIPLLLRAAPSMDGRGQFHAVHLLELFPAEAETAFARLLNCDAPQLRFLAARYLSQHGKPGMTAVMITALEDPAFPADRRAPLLDRVREGAPIGIRPTIAAWLTPEVEVGLADRVLRHFLEMRDGGSVAAVERLLEHQDRSTRLRAAAFLLRFGSKKASDTLDAMLKADNDAKPGDWRLMRPYLKALPRLPARLQTALVEQLELTEVRGQLTPLLEILKDHWMSAAADRLHELIEHDEKDVRHDAFGVFDWHARWQTPELIALLDVEDPLLRVKAADALRRADDLTGLEVLLAAVGEEGPAREEACRVLAACRLREGVSPLIEALAASEPSTREAAATGLESLLWSLFPYRRFELASTGYDPKKAAEPNAAAIATLRDWWARHQGEDW